MSADPASDHAAHPASRGGSAMQAGAAGLVAAGIGEVSWDRPAGLLALALVPLVLLLSRVLARPAPVLTGTLDVWASIRARPVSGSGSRARIPPAVLLLALALLLGALALAGPRRLPQALRSGVLVVLDRSPSMYLAHGGETRLARALAQAAAHRRGAQAVSGADAPTVWAFDDGERLVRAAGPSPPRAWREPPATPLPEPRWREHDLAGAVWITDRVPLPPPARATVVASGGAAVPGPVAAQGDARFDWDGERLIEVRGGVPRRRVAIVGRLAAPLARMVGVWADARGFDVAALPAGRATGDAAGEAADGATGSDPGVATGGPRDRTDTPIALTLVSVAGSAAEVVEIGRDGWRSRGEAAALESTLTTWLATREQRTLVAAGRGRIEVGLSSLEEPEGDPAAFAVSWARLLDACVLPPPGVIALRERLDAGEARITEGLAGSGGEPTGDDPSLPAWLAVAAALCASLAVGLVLAPMRVAAARPKRAAG